METLKKTSRIEYRKLNNVVGDTPLIKLKNVFRKTNVSISAKLEWMQFGGSVKSRPAWYIIKAALESGALQDGATLLDASSGNTAIAYAALGAALNIPVAICLPENAGNKRKDILLAHGAKLIYTSKFGGTDEAQVKAKELFENNPNRYFYADQYNNINNWKAHYHTTAEEIYRQTRGKVTHLVIGLGTSGTAMGTFKRLYEYNSNISLITLQPEFALHNLEGWKHMDTAMVPGIYDPLLASKNIAVDSEAALKLIPKVARQEGLLLSPSAAGNLLGAMQVANELEDAHVVTIFPDNAEKYPEVLKSF